MALPPTINVQVDADTARALADILIFAKEADAALGSIGSDVSFNKDKEANEGGEDAGKSFWKGYGKEDNKGAGYATKRFTRLLAKWTAIVSSFGETIGVALYGAGGALTSFASSLVQAIGAAGAFVPIAVGIGAALATIVIGSAGVKDGFTAVNEELKTAVKEGRAFNVEAEGIQAALKNLAPSAQELVLAFAGVRQQLADIQAVVQQELFKGLGASLTSLAQKQLPGLQDALAGVAGALNTAFNDLLITVNSFDLGRILDGLTPIIANVAGALAPLSTAFLQFLQIATPYAVTLSEQFGLWAERLADFVVSADGTTKIQDFLQRSLDSLNSWLDLIGSLGSAIGSFLEIASASGDGLVDSLTGVVDKFNEWLNSDSGREAVLTFLSTSETIVKSLAPLLDGLVGFFDELVSAGAVDRFAELASTLGEILPLLAKILDITSEADLLNLVADAILAIGTAIEDSGLLDSLVTLATALGQGLGKVLDAIVKSGALDIIGTGLSIVADSLVGFLDALLTPEVLTAFQDALSALGLAIASLGPLLAELGPVLGQVLGDSIIQLSSLIVALLPLFLELVDAIFPIIDAAALWLTAMVAVEGFITKVLVVAIQVLTAILAPLVEWLGQKIGEGTEEAVAAFESLKESLGLVGEFFQKTIDVIVDIWDGLWQALSDLYVEFFGAFVSDIGGYFRGAVDTFQSAWDTIKGGFSDFIDFFTGLWDDAKSAWDDTLEDLRQFGRDAVSFFSELPGRITSALSDVKDAIIEPFKEAWEKAKEYVDKIKNLPGTIAGGIGGAVSGAFNRVVGNNARGTIVTQATKMIAGEAGAEAVIPLTRPLSQIDPSVRMMAALLRGEGPKQQQAQAAPSRGTGMVNNWVINDMTGNAEATAQKVLNRLALV